MPFAMGKSKSKYGTVYCNLVNFCMIILKCKFYVIDILSCDVPLYGPRREKTCLRGFRQSETQTSLLGYIGSLEI